MRGDAGMWLVGGWCLGGGLSALGIVQWMEGVVDVKAQLTVVWIVPWRAIVAS